MVDLTDPVLTTFKPDEENNAYAAAPLKRANFFPVYSLKEVVPITFAIGERLDHVGIAFGGWGPDEVLISPDFPWPHLPHTDTLIYTSAAEEYQEVNGVPLQWLALMHIDHLAATLGKKIMDIYLIGRDEILFYELNFTDDGKERPVSELQAVEEFDGMTDDHKETLAWLRRIQAAAFNSSTS